MGRREPRSPWTRSLLKGSTNDLSARQQRRGVEMTVRQLYNENAFLARVNFAEKCFRNHQTHTRAMDSCFEMYDGAAVVVALVRRARLDGALYAAIASDWSDRFPAEWLDLETKYSHIPTERLVNLARELRAAPTASPWRPPTCRSEPHSASGHVSRPGHSPAARSGIRLCSCQDAGLQTLQAKRRRNTRHRCCRVRG